MFAAAQSPSEVERQILVDLDNIDKYSTYLGGYDETKIDQANKALQETLMRNGKRLDILRYAFPKLKDKMYVATSADAKLRIYSWDLGTGGTMHDIENVYQFQGKSGSINTWMETGNEESGGGGYCSQIFQVNSQDGPIYFAISTFVAQGTLHGQSINAIRINGEVLDVKAKAIRTGSGLVNSIDFAYDPASLGERSESLIHFDPTKQEFRFPIVVEDKTYENGRVTNRFITYRFNGQYFVKI
jgi:hypothetical protein